MTGVLKAERGRGLGKWLKAQMLLHIRETYPVAIYINSSSASVKKPMLSINQRIGFQEYQQFVFYKLQISALKNYLNID